MTQRQDIRHPQLVEIADDFESASARLARLRERVPPGRWFQRNAADRWSPGECVVHLNLTGAAFIPLLRDALARAPVLEEGKPRHLRRDVLGWFLWRIMPPPVRGMRVKTGSGFVPQEIDPDEMIATFERLQAEQVDLVAAAEGRAIDRVFIASPFNARARYNAYAALGILPRHQHRHLWQAEQAL